MDMKFLKALILSLLLIAAFTANSGQWSLLEIRATGKNLASLSGFYEECSNRGIVKKNGHAIRWASYMGAKYLIISGDEAVHLIWVKKGKNGILINDPTTSEETFEADFTKEFCSRVKEHLDSQYQLADQYISGDYKDQ